MSNAVDPLIDILVHAQDITRPIEPVGDSCRLTVTHDQLRDGANDQLFRGVADDPVWAQDLARNRRVADHSRITYVRN